MMLLKIQCKLALPEDHLCVCVFCLSPYMHFSILSGTWTRLEADSELPFYSPGAAKAVPERKDSLHGAPHLRTRFPERDQHPSS